jgi:multidrug efflux pump subunit AcrA (membrane-fusion protein)
MTAAATIVIDEKNDVLVVPLRAVHRQGRDQVVDVVGDDGKTVSRTVKTGVQSDQLVEITDGLQDGEQIMIQGTTTRTPTGGRGLPGGGPGPGGAVFVGR